MKALILTLATLLPLAAAQPIGPSEEAFDPGQGPRGQRFSQALQLTADQEAKLQSLRASHRTALAPQRQAAQEARATLAKALRESTTPEAALRELHQRASSAQFQLLLARRAHLAQVRALLTPEQREKAAVIWATHRERVRGQMRRMRMRARG